MIFILPFFSWSFINQLPLCILWGSIQKLVGIKSEFSIYSCIKSHYIYNNIYFFITFFSALFWVTIIIKISFIFFWGYIKTNALIIINIMMIHLIQCTILNSPIIIIVLNNYPISYCILYYKQFNIYYIFLKINKI